MRRIWKFLALAIALTLGMGGAESQAANSLDWHAKQDQVDANIDNQSLIPVLKKIARVTGWRVFVEPGAATSVSVKFKELSQDEALRRLLGKLNYFKYETNGVTRLLVFRSIRSAATEAVLAEKKDHRIHDEDLVKMKRGASTNSIDELAKKVGAKITARDDKIGLYKLQFPDGTSADSALGALASDPSVAGADGNYSYDRPQPASMTQVPNPAGSMFNINPQPNANGPIIGLVDTSVDPPAQFQPYMLTPINVTGVTDTPGDDPTHGTGMLETMVEAMANDPSKILPVDVFGSGESTSDYEVMEGIVSAINKGANPINLSLGDTDDSSMLGSLIAEAEKDGVYFIAASGNTPGEGKVYPADYPGVISVTASSQVVTGPITSSANVSGGQGGLASYANDPEGTDVMAPGTSYVQWNGQTWVVEGTSPATASTTGTIADLMNQDHMTLPQAINQVMKVAPAPGR
ncbi:MAG TPA: S8 family serine peptidase [Verrucomicrobiae bacterium]